MKNIDIKICILKNVNHVFEKCNMYKNNAFDVYNKCTTYIKNIDIKTLYI